MQFLRPGIWLGLALLTAWVALAADRSLRQVQPSSPVVLRPDIVHELDSSRWLFLDVYFPPDRPGSEGARPRPAILLIHGGSWIGGSRQMFRPGPGNPRSMAIELAEAGYVVVATDYRLAQPFRAAWPAALDDVREAVRYLRSHANELGVDPDRIAAVGQSAGGHLAALLGTPIPADDPSVRVRAVVSLYGPTNLVALPSGRTRRLDHEPVAALLGGDPVDLAGPAHVASPVFRVGGDAAPMLLIHGTRDAWVPIAQSHELATALARAGVRHRLITVEGARHGFDFVVNDPELSGPRPGRLLPEVLAFLEACGMLTSGKSR